MLRQYLCNHPPIDLVIEKRFSLQDIYQVEVFSKFMVQSTLLYVLSIILLIMFGPIITGFPNNILIYPILLMFMEYHINGYVDCNCSWDIWYHRAIPMMLLYYASNRVFTLFLVASMFWVCCMSNLVLSVVFCGLI